MRATPTAEKILNASARLFDSEGAESVTMRRVADAVGITPMAIYRHFANRDALLTEIAYEGLREAARALDDRARDPDVLQRIKALLEPYLDFALTHPHRFDYAFSGGRDAAVRSQKDLDPARSPLIRVAVETVEEGMAKGLFKPDDPLEVVLTLWAHQHGLIALYRAGRLGHDQRWFQRFCSRSLDRLLDGLRR